MSGRDGRREGERMRGRREGGKPPVLQHTLNIPKGLGGLPIRFSFVSRLLPPKH